MLRCCGTKRSGASFDAATVEAVWQKGRPLPGITTLREDVCGAPMQRDRYGVEAAFGWEIDHIKPVSRGGTDALVNLQPLQWQSNRRKADDWPYWQYQHGP